MGDSVVCSTLVIVVSTRGFAMKTQKMLKTQVSSGTDDSAEGEHVGKADEL